VELTGEQAASFPQLAMVLRGARKKAEATTDTCGHGHAAASSHTCGLAASRAAAKVCNSCSTSWAAICAS
jgi:hypothetical protein